MATGFTIDHTTGELMFNGGTMRLAAGANVEAGSQFKVLDGSVSAPAVTNYGDENTGIYFPKEEAVALVGSGVELLRVDGETNTVSLNGTVTVNGEPLGGSSGVTTQQATVLAMIFGG